MSNRNKSVAPYNPRGQSNPSNELSLFGNHRAAFDDFDRMADRMMSNFGMPKMDMSNNTTISYINLLIVMPSFGRGGDPFMNDPFFADSGFGRMDQMMNDMRK